MRKLLLLMGVSVFGADPALIQQVNISSSNSTTAVATIATPSAGNALCVVFGLNSSTITISSITGGGVTWAQIKRNATQRVAEIWCGPDSSGSGTTITITMSAKADLVGKVSEWSGIVTSSLTDVTGSNSSASSANPATGDITTTNACDLILATEKQGSGQALVSGPTNSFTAFSAMGGTQGLAAYRVVSSTGTYSTDWTIAAASSWGAAIAAIKGSSCGGGGTVVKDVIRRGVIAAPR